MDFNFSINAIFKEKLSKVRSNLLPDGYPQDRRGDGDTVMKVSTILDKMGAVSSVAQNLPHVLTSAAKLRDSNHVVYILTDPEGNRGHGSVVGILKVGFKKLFMYDLDGSQWEIEPACVLDFYVHEQKQRSGCGKALFDYMLKDQNVQPDHLALDQPSESFLAFMCKHYGLDSIIPQNNNFVVYDAFFSGRSDSAHPSRGASSSSRKVARKPVQCVKTSNRAEPLPSYGRHSAKKAECTMGQYMRDSSATGKQNGSRPYTTNHHIPVNKNSMTPQEEESYVGGGDSLNRPTSFPEKLNGTNLPPKIASEVNLESNSGTDVPDAKQNTDSNGTTTPEDVPGRLDIKFHHTHLCNYNPDIWSLNNHSVPLAQYGHYWSTVGELLSEDQEEDHVDNATYQNGTGNSQRVRKISNIPIGEEKRGDHDDASLSSDVNAESEYRIGGPGVRDVRIKKSMFKNLSPYRK